MDAVASIRVGQAPPRQCRVLELELDGMFVQDLYGVVQNERVEIELTVPGRPALSAQGIVRRVVDALEAQKRSATSGVAIAWTHPPAELLAAIDDSTGTASSIRAGGASSAHSTKRSDRSPARGDRGAQALEGLTPGLRYKIAL
jgi:hypothetical protein